MKLKDLRKVMMNSVMEELRAYGPYTHAQLVTNLLPVCLGINEATISACLKGRLAELVERDYIQSYPPGTWGDIAEYYSPSDRMFNDCGYWIGHELIDPEWPPYFGKEEKKK
jgi:hypothetical protein